MHRIVKDFEKYCYEALGTKPRTQPWGEAGTLPLFLREGYEFYEATLNDVVCLLAVDLKLQEQPPASVAKQLAQVRQRANRHVVYLRTQITSYNRQRLIGQKMPFVIPGSQMYLPMVCMDLREHFGTPPRAKPTLSPATQSLVLNALCRKNYEPITPGWIAQVLGYTPMTMTRAFRELNLLNIGEHMVRGKNRRLHFAQQGRELWQTVLPYLRTPVKRTFYVDGPLDRTSLPAAGLTALARYTMIGEPATEVCASSMGRWKAIRNTVREIPLAEDGKTQIELWSYRPELFAQNGIVDRLSLFLSLKDEQDERIAKALDELMEHFPW